MFTPRAEAIIQGRTICQLRVEHEHGGTLRVVIDTYLSQVILKEIVESVPDPLAEAAGRSKRKRSKTKKNGAVAASAGAPEPKKWRKRTVEAADVEGEVGSARRAKTEEPEGDMAMDEEGDGEPSHRDVDEEGEDSAYVPR